MKPDPMGERRNPFQVYLLCLAVMTGVTSLLPGESTAGSTERFLSDKGLYLFGALLTVGSVLTLAGMYWQGDARDGLLMKRLGLMIVAAMCEIYALIVVAYFHLAGLSFALALAGFGYAAGVQCRHVHRHIKYLIWRTRSGFTNGAHHE